MSIQGLFLLRLTSLISFLSKGISGVFSSSKVRRHHFFAFCLLYGPALTTVCDHWEDHCLDYTWTFDGKVMSLLFNMLSRFVIAFLPRSNCLLISWLQSMSAEMLEPKKRKSVTTSTFSPYICHAVMGVDAMILVFLIFSLKQALSLPFFTLIKRLFSSSSLSSAIRPIHCTTREFPPSSFLRRIICSVLHGSEESDIL